MPEALKSPRMAILERSLLSADSGSALEAFWSQVDSVGTPLIERVPGKKDRIFATFVWRAEDARDQLNIGVTGVLKGSFEDRVDLLQRLQRTDIWYRTYEMESSARFQYYLAWPEGRRPATESVERHPTDGGVLYELFKDPRSSRNVKFELGSSLVSYAEGPDAPPEPWLVQRNQVRKGETATVQVTSAILDNVRDVTVYTPPGYQTRGKPYSFVLIFDRSEYLQTIGVPVLFDNMIADGVIAPMAAILVGYVDREGELTANRDFARFIAQELLPKMHKDWNLTQDPQRTVIAGASYGGLASAFIAHAHPELFGNVLSQSGSYWWHPGYDLSREEEERFRANWGWLPHRLFVGKKLPLRFYLDVGTWEGAGMLLPNRSFRDLLRAKGYEVSYREFVGGHTYLNWRSTFPEGLIALVGTEKGRAFLQKKDVFRD